MASKWNNEDTFDLLGDIPPVSKPQPQSSTFPSIPISYTGSASQSTVENTANSNEFPISSLELPIYFGLFKIADNENSETIGPQRAVEFLSKSKLSQEILSVVWKIADKEQQGFLDKKSFFRALKLIAAAQDKLPIIEQTLQSKTSLPQFEGISNNDFSAPVANLNLNAGSPQRSMTTHSTGIFGTQSPSTGVPLSSSASTQGVSGAFKISEKERDRFLAAFQSCKPVDNLVQGDAARDLFMKSSLSVVSLKSIWDLVDPKGLGVLGRTQFFVAMYIITRMKQGSLTAVPAQIPPQLWEVLNEQPSSTVGSTVSDKPPLSRTMTAHKFESSFNQSFNTAVGETSSLSESSTQWAISSAEKTVYDGYFDAVDVKKAGFLSGEQAYEFFLKSELSQQQLAKIWDLSDSTKAGKLNKEEFAVAMALIKLCKAGQTLPNELPYEFLPPSRRGTINHSKNASSIQPAVALSFNTASPVAIKPSVDLLSDSFDAQNTKTSSLAATAATAAVASTFGNISSQQAGVPLSSQPTGAGRVSNSLFTSFSDLNVNKEIQEKEQDLESKKRELVSLRSSLAEIEPNLEEMKQKRAELESELSKVRDERNNVNLKLSQIKVMYDTEATTIQEFTNSLNKERQILLASASEIQEAENILAAVTAEKESLLKQLDKTKQDIEQIKSQTLVLTEQSAPLKTEIDQHRMEILKLVQTREVNEKMLTSVQEEYNNFKMDIGTETRHLEAERNKVAQIKQQIQVQTAINDKEKADLEAFKLEKATLATDINVIQEQLDALILDKENIAKEKAIVISNVEESKKLKEKLTQKVVVENEVVSKLKKDLEVTKSVPVEEFNIVPAVVPLTVSGANNEIVTKEINSPLDEPEIADNIDSPKPIVEDIPKSPEVTSPVVVQDKIVEPKVETGSVVSPVASPASPVASSTIPIKSPTSQVASSTSPVKSESIKESVKSGNPFDTISTPTKVESQANGASFSFIENGVPPSVDEFETMFSTNSAKPVSTENSKSNIDIDQEFAKAFNETPVSNNPIEEVKKPIFGSLSKDEPKSMSKSSLTQSFATQFNANDDVFKPSASNTSSNVVPTNSASLDEAFSVFNKGPINAPITISETKSVESVKSVEAAKKPIEVTKPVESTKLEEPKQSIDNLQTNVTTSQHSMSSDTKPESLKGSITTLDSELNGKTASSSATPDNKDHKKDKSGKNLVNRLFNRDKKEKKEKTDKKAKRENSIKTTKHSSPQNSAPQSPINAVGPTVDDPGTLTAMFAGDPDSDEVKQLTALGFSKEKALDALERYAFDVSKATNYLLDQQ